MITGRLSGSGDEQSGPRKARPTNAVIEVATPVIVRTPLGISSIYTPGKVGLTGMREILRSQDHHFNDIAGINSHSRDINFSQAPDVSGALDLDSLPFSRQV